MLCLLPPLLSMAPLANHLEGLESPVARLSCRSSDQLVDQRGLPSVQTEHHWLLFRPIVGGERSTGYKSLDRGLRLQVEVLLFSFAFVVKSFHQLHSKEFSQLSKPYQHLALGAPVPNVLQKQDVCFLLLVAKEKRFDR